MRRFRCRAVFILGLLLAVNTLADERLRIGVSPWTSGQLLKAWMDPVVNHIEHHGGARYHFASGNSLHEYLIRVAREELDLITIPMHMGLFLVEELGFIPLVFIRADVDVMLVTHSESPYKTLADLNGVQITVADPISITGLITESLLKDKGFEYSVNYLGHHWKLTDALIKRQIQVAPIVGNHVGVNSGKLSKKLRVLHRFPHRLDGLMMVNPKADAKTVKQLREILSSFSPASHSMIKKMDKVTEPELAQWQSWLAPFFPIIKQRMKALDADFAKEMGWE